MHGALAMDQIKIDVLWAMRQQEQKVYRIKRPNIRLESNTSICDSKCRYNMIDWCYRMIDFCQMNSEIVAIAMNFVDRFVTTSNGQCYLMDDAMYQLVVISALYTAVKIHAIQSIDLVSLSTLSKGAYSVKQIEKVENEMIHALEWRMNPPTAMSFVRSLLDVVSDNYVVSDETKERILRLSQIQTDQALFEEELAQIRMSIIGYCSLINAIGTVVTDNTAVNDLICMLAQAIDINIEDEKEVEEVQLKLFLLLPNPRPKDSIWKGNVKIKSLYKGNMLESITEPSGVADIQVCSSSLRQQNEASMRLSAYII